MTNGNGTGVTMQGLRQGVLGPFQIAFFVISAAGPLVAMAGGIPIAMLFGNGAGIPAMFLAASLILLAFSAAYTAMAREVRNAGAFYAFAARGLGRGAAGSTGLVALLSYNAIQIGLYGLFGAAAKALLNPLLGADIAWWAYAFAALAGVAFLGYRQVDLSARILGVLVAGEYLVVLALVLFILATGGDAGLSARPFAPDIIGSGAPAIGLMLCFSAFIGFEATTIYSEEARDPARTVPLATYMSVLLIGGFYTLATWAVVNGAGAGKLMGLLTSSDPTELLFSLSDRFAGAWLSLTMRILFVTSAFASLLAFHNAIARYLFAMGRERLLAPTLAAVHPRHGSPAPASLVQSGFAFACLLLFIVGGADPILTVFTLPSAVATLGIIILMATTSLAAVRFLGRRPDAVRSRILGTAAFLTLSAVAMLATIRFDVLAGGGPGWVRWLPLVLPAAALVGLWLVRRLALRDPAAHARLGLGETT
jgi:amino acid transporter